MLRAGRGPEVVGVVDDAPSVDNLARLAARDTRYLGTVNDWIAADSDKSFVLAIGSPDIRHRLAEQLESAGMRAFTAIHPSATIGRNSRIAEGTVVSARAVISTNVQLGRHVHINPGAIIGHDVIAHDFVSVNPGATISGAVELHSFSLVGAAATVLQGIEVGEHVVLGAGTVLTTNCPDHVVVKGVPGRW